jgi:type III secretion protein HrpB1
MHNRNEYLNCSTDLIGGLIETATTALMESFPNTSVNTDDVEALLVALHVLRPNTVELDTLDGILQIVRSQWPEAIRILRAVNERVPQFDYAKALLAFSLSAAGDPIWRQYADELLAGNAARSIKALVMAVVARNDMLEAVRTTRMGGAFVTPESLAALQAMTEEAAGGAPHVPAQGGIAQDALAVQQMTSFMRV